MNNCLKSFCWILFIVFFLPFFYFSYVEFKLQSHEDKSFNLVPIVHAQEAKNSCKSLDFHYLVFENHLMTEKLRSIEVFLDTGAFSEENLRELFEHLSKKNPYPFNLIIKVHTDWSQLPIKSECPLTVVSEQPNIPDDNNYYQAMYTRRKRERVIEYFTYNPELKTDKVKLVVLKGEAPK